METRLVSFDTSTNQSGAALYLNGKLIDYVLIDHSKIKDTDIRINEMIKSLLHQLKLWKPHIIWIEHPQGNGRNVDMVSKLSEILGAVRAYAVEKNCDYHEVNPSVWRKYAGFEQGKKNRNELKQMSMDYVKEHFNIDVNNDVADAISIGCSVINYYEMF